MSDNVILAQAVVKPTLGNRISSGAKAVAALLMAFLALFNTVITLVAEWIPAEAALWINTAVAFATAAAVWLVANGPRVGAAFDLFVEDSGEAVGEIKDQIG